MGKQECDFRSSGGLSSHWPFGFGATPQSSENIHMGVMQPTNCTAKIRIQTTRYPNSGSANMHHFARSMSWVQLDRGGQDGITADTRSVARILGASYAIS